MSSILPDQLAENLWARVQRDQLKRFVAGKVRDESVREDVIQETLARLVNYTRANPVANMGGLARTIAKNLINDHFRRKQLYPTQPLEDYIPCDDPLQEQVVMHKQRLEQFSRQLADMPPLRREVLVRRRLRGESHEQIARDLNLTVEAVEKHMSRALRQLCRDEKTI